MKYIAILISLFLLALSFPNLIIAQDNDVDFEEFDSLDTDTIDTSISEYNKYTPLLGGEEFRFKDGLKINGMVKDYYSDSTLKHKGYYQDGQLVSTYKNYYPNGVVERSFAASGTFKLIIESFYENGSPKEYVEYRKGEVIKYVEYYANGNMTTYEEHDKKKGYYIALRNYYSNGKMKSSLELVDKKKWSYYEKEFFSNGKVKEEGPVQYHETQYDYQRHGDWKVFNDKGQLMETRIYYEGELVL